MFVSIHAPRVGRDGTTNGAAITEGGFNPRAPRGARLKPAALLQRSKVSIHAPRVGRDQCSASAGWHRNVSIHAPRVGRDEKNGKYYADWRVSIHAPRVGRDILIKELLA